jgi:biotin synthase-related radical SAM superfamily protein
MLKLWLAFPNIRCLDCNRPFYNENQGPIYNYPNKPYKEEIRKSGKQLT